MSKEALKILVGCDPEVFVKDQAGAFVSAHGMIPGTKREPFKVPNGAVQVDGNALEFNIDPASDRAQFYGNVSSVLAQMTQMVPGYNVVIEPVAIFEQGYFDRLPDVAKELGCDPDFNAYTGEANSPPRTDQPMRTAAGHIHIGWTEDVNPADPNHFKDCCAVVKQMDWYLGMYSLLWDQDATRRSLYGKAGAFRPKPYGVEYRTLSNKWLQSPELIMWVFDATKKAVVDLYNGWSADAHNPGWAAAMINSNSRKSVLKGMNTATQNLVPPPVEMPPKPEYKPGLKFKARPILAENRVQAMEVFDEPLAVVLERELNGVLNVAREEPFVRVNGNF